MGDLSERDVEDVLGGVQPPGRDDLAHVVELTTWLHVSREIEPPPAMRDDLFCQIDDGLWVYQRSSRRAPAHLRHRRTGTGRWVRETLAGSRRPIASVAAAAVLLVGVVLTVRAGGPAREPSAFVSPSAQGLPASGADAPATTTTVAPTTTSPPERQPQARAGTETTVPDSEHSTTPKRSTESPASTDTTSAKPQSPDHDGTTPPTTEKRRGERDDDGATAESDQSSVGGRTQPPPPSEPSDDTMPWKLPLSGWDFDLSEWPPAEDLWAAVEEAHEMQEPMDPGDDGLTGDSERNHDPSEVGESERGSVEDG